MGRSRGCAHRYRVALVAEGDPLIPTVARRGGTACGGRAYGTAVPVVHVPVVAVVPVVVPVVSVVPVVVPVVSVVPVVVPVVLVPVVCPHATRVSATRVSP